MDPAERYESDSDRVPLDDLRHALTNGERRDAQVRVLEALGAHLSEQMAELATGQQEASKSRAEFAAEIASIKKSLAENTQVTTDVREILEYAKMGIRVIGWLGVFMKLAGGAAAGFIALWALWQAIKHGTPYPPGGK